MNNETRTCQNCKNQFTIEPDDFTFYKKMGVPPPTFCPECRLKRRLMFRNERTYYRRKCDLCKKDIIATYPADVSFPVYCQKCWWGDGWDPFSYARDFDFSKSFFEQFEELYLAVPHLSIQNDDGIGSTNSEYAYDFAFSKNCYMTAAGWYVENGMYSYYTCYDKDVVDCYFVNNSELMYQCIAGDKCYRCSYCTFTYDSRDCTFCYDMRGCSDCILSVGLRNKQYCIFNKQYSREEYLAEKERMRLHAYDSMQKLRGELDRFALTFPRKYANIVKSVTTSGNVLINCKASRNSFFADNLENSSFILFVDGAKDCYDCNNTGRPNSCYEGLTPDESYKDIATVYCWRCTEVSYSHNCHGSEYLFGCSGVKKGSYAILNKRFSKEEYEIQKEKIEEHMKKTGEWGEFFPFGFSPFAYNETSAHERYPLVKDEAMRQGFGWKEPEEKNYKVDVLPDDVPNTIVGIGDEITNKVIGCTHAGTCNEKCTTAFRVTPLELQFYRKMNLPLPRLCPNCRHYERFNACTPTKLWTRACMCGGEKSERGVYTNSTEHSHGDSHCPNKFETSYSPERQEIVYCETCYQKEVV